MIRMTDFDDRTYHRVDYRVQSLVRTSASTTANNSASDCTDDTNTGSGDRSASPPMCAGVRVVVLARVLSRKCQSDRAIRAIARVCCCDRNTRMVAVPVYAEQPGCFEATPLDKRTQGYGPWPIYFIIRQAGRNKRGRSLLTLRLTLPALLRSDVRR